MDETYIKVKGQWVYLYCAVDQFGGTIDGIEMAYMIRKKQLTDENISAAYQQFIVLAG